MTDSNVDDLIAQADVNGDGEIDYQGELYMVLVALSGAALIRSGRIPEGEEYAIWSDSLTVFSKQIVRAN